MTAWKVRGSQGADLRGFRRLFRGRVYNMSRWAENKGLMFHGFGFLRNDRRIVLSNLLGFGQFLSN